MESIIFLAFTKLLWWFSKFTTKCNKPFNFFSFTKGIDNYAELPVYVNNGGLFLTFTIPAGDYVKVYRYIDR